MATVELSTAEQKAVLFLDLLFGDGEGYICIANRNFQTKSFGEAFFNFPGQAAIAVRYAMSLADNNDVWICPHLLSVKERKKDKVIYTGCLWADLDTCNPSVLQTEPSITVESSPGRWQAYWIFDGTVVEPIQAENYSKRIAYAYADQGCDRSGWDLTQLLRFPYTLNFKYYSLESGAPTVRIASTGPKYRSIKSFDIYEAPVSTSTGEGVLLPDELPDMADVMAKYKNDIPASAHVLMMREPKGDWSKALWTLSMMLLEAGLSPVETFVLVDTAACNKYDRDNRSNQYLWRDICKAYDEVSLRAKPKVNKELQSLLSVDEHERAAGIRTILNDYIDMCLDMTDAAPEYHQAGILTILSNILTDKILLDVEWGEIIPNLWFLILADTTLTRKTTSMDIAMDILEEVQPDGVVATDGSLEGIFHALSLRSSKPSIFLRDEFTGLIDSMAKKEYYAGMLEMFAKLYDGKYQKKILRSGTIEIRKPMFQIFGGGIRSRLLEILTTHHIDSGFLPRFVMILGETDLTKVRPIGPRRAVIMEKRDKMIDRLIEIRDHYTKDDFVTVNGLTVASRKVFKCELTEEAWLRCRILEAAMNQDANDSILPETLTPMFARLMISGLKVAMLLAAARQRATDTIEVELDDILVAFMYVDIWRKWTLEVCKNVGNSTLEVQIQKVVAMGKRAGAVKRSDVMRTLRLTVKQAEELIGTMEQRGLIIRAMVGKDQSLTLIGSL